MQKVLYFIAVFFLITLNNEFRCLGQNRIGDTPSKGQTRREKRALTRKTDQLVDSLNFAGAKNGIDSKKWSLVIKTVYDKTGMPVQNNDPRNIISMKGETAHLRLDFKYDGMGKNGLGNLSANGPVVDYSKTVDKKGVVMIRFLVFQKGKNEEVVIILHGNGNQADGEIKSATTGKGIRFMGNLGPLEKRKNSRDLNSRQ